MPETDRINFHKLRPDYSSPLFQLNSDARSEMLDHLTAVYGASASRKTMQELERLMQVYYAHKTPDMLDWERSFKPADRFTERDAILITYGDLIRDEQNRPLSALSEMSDRYLKNVFNTLHILPFFPYSSDRGFAVVTFFGVDPNLGTWEDILLMKKNFKLMFDGVFNHISAKSRWFQEFLNQSPEFKDFFTSYALGTRISKTDLQMLFRPRTSDVFTTFDTLNGARKVWTTFGPDQVDLNFRNPAVFLKIVEILLLYVRRGADLLRLDAVTYLWNELGTTGVHHKQTHSIIKLFRCILNSVAPHVAIVTETNVPHEQNISYFGNGSDEAQMVYNFALPPLILHTFRSQDSTKISQWAESLKTETETAAFFNFLDSHDGIGLMGVKNILSPAEIAALVTNTEKHGGYVSFKSESDGSQSPYELNITSYSALSHHSEDESFRISKYLAARSIPLVLAGVPGVYIHGLIGSENDIEAVRATSEKRDINRKNLSKKHLFEALENKSSVTARITGGICSMLKLRQKESSFSPSAAQEVLNAGPSFFCIRRKSHKTAESIIAVVNITQEIKHLKLSGPEISGTFKDLITGRTLHVLDACLNTTMTPFEIMWLKSL